MNAISIRQPWAWAILHAGKDVENRSWPSVFRGTVLIHTGVRYDPDGAVWIREQFSIDVPKRSELDRGGIVGMVDIKGMVRSYDSRWAVGPWVWLLENPVELQFEPCRGSLGIFNVDVPIRRKG